MGGRNELRATKEFGRCKAVTVELAVGILPRWVSGGVTPVAELATSTLPLTSGGGGGTGTGVP